MPSAEGQGSHWIRERTRRTIVRAGLAVFGAVACAILLCLAAVIFLVSSDWGTRTLRAQAERALQAAAGQRASVSVGPTSIALDFTHPIALRIEDVSLGNLDSKATIASIKAVDFGIRLLPLLRGELQLGSASISDATITTGALPEFGGSDWTKALRDQNGLIDPDRVAVAVFEPLHAVFGAVDSGLFANIALSNITVMLPEGERLRTVRIAEGSVSRTAPDTLRIDAEADVDGRPVTLAGTAVRDPASRRVADLDLSIVGSQVASPAQPISAGRLGGFSLTVSGGEGADTQPPRLKLSAVVDESVLDFGARGALVGNLRVDATLAGSHKVEVDRLLLQTGGTSLEFNGAFGPRPPTGAVGDKPVYRYELVSTRTVVAPEGSPEAPLDFMTQLEGTLDPVARILSADRIAIKSGPGELLGTAKVDLVQGQAPGIALAVSARDMQVAHAKQLWPWFAGTKARAWVLDHVFGGNLDEANIEFRVRSGRLGNGVPLSAEEITGRFAVKDTRFDTFGKLPPIRDADGVVEVRGRDVDITMSAGTVYLPSGRSVTGSDGTLAFRGPQPAIGKLDVKVQGAADAIVELAAIDPINALRFLPLGPADMTGAVSGHVIADIPIQKGIDPATLDWMVALDFNDLSIAKPFDGQTLTSADGTLTVEPTQATMVAKGQLNGVPAEINMVEPLRAGAPKRDQKVVLVLDDAARRKVAPGLDALIAGTAKVTIEIQDGVRKATADLSAARLDIPWAGWSKGAGVAASATFSMRRTDNGTVIPDLKVSGETFSIAGELTLSGAAVSSARFDRMRLNRGDDIKVAIDRSGKGYRVDITGSSFDARSVIKSLLAESGGKKAAPAQSASVTIDADVAKLTGFNGETLSGVKITSTAGGNLSLTASAGSGGAVTFSNGTASGRKHLQLQAANAGAVLRFLDLYDKVRGGSIKLSLAGTADGGMSGQIDARDFRVVNEPRLASIVSTAPAGSDRSLSQEARKPIDTSSVEFERGYAQIARGGSYLRLANGVLRGPAIGATFQGTLYDQRGRMDMTGTFMPAYGINRIFGELPLVGDLLGNGRDRGLIGVTFKLDGPTKSPRLQVNPLSVMAPGIFRQIFEFN